MIDTQTLAWELADTHDITRQVAAQGVATYLRQINDIDGTDPDSALPDEVAAFIRGAFVAEYGTAGRTLPLQQVAEQTEARATAQAALDSADDEWRQAIRGALDAGASAAEVAAEAGITRGRVWQIKRDRR